jgi:hypothetical protein
MYVLIESGKLLPVLISKVIPSPAGLMNMFSCLVIVGTVQLPLKHVLNLEYSRINVDAIFSPFN